MQADIEDIGNRVLDISERVALQSLRDDLEDIELRLDHEIGRLKQVKEQVRRIIPQISNYAETSSRAARGKPIGAIL